MLGIAATTIEHCPLQWRLICTSPRLSVSSQRVLRANDLSGCQRCLKSGTRIRPVAAAQHAQVQTPPTDQDSGNSGVCVRRSSAASTLIGCFPNAHITSNSGQRKPVTSTVLTANSQTTPSSAMMRSMTSPLRPDSAATARVCSPRPGAMVAMRGLRRE